MKKMYLSIAILIISVAFISCSKNTNSLSMQINEDKSQENIKNLSVITSGGTLLSSQYAFTDNGFYEILEHSTREGSILYTDFTSNERMYLTSDLALETDSNENSSYIDSISEGSCLALTDKNLYIIKRGSPQQENKDEYKRTIIEQRDLTGGNLKKIYLDTNIILSEDSVIVYDGNNLYFSVSEYAFNKDNEAVNATAKILMLDCNNLTLTTFYEFEYGDFVDIKGAIKDNIIITKSHYDKEKSVGHSQIFSFNITSKSIKKIADLSQNKWIYKVVNDNIYIFDGKNATLEAINLNTGSIFKHENLFDRNIYNKISLVADVFDNHLFFYTYIEKDSTSQNWALNLDTFDVKELKLYNGEDKFIGIYGETETDFLVITGQKIVRYTEKETEKMPSFENERLVYEIKKISKKDYWGNIPNYIDIADANIIYK